MSPRIEKFAAPVGHLQAIAGTDHAILVRNRYGHEVWLPKSQLTTNAAGETVVPEWIIEKRVLV